MLRATFSLLLALAFHSSLPAQLTFDYGGETRTYFMDAPDPIPPGAPLVFVLHGYSSSAAVIRTYSGMGNLAIEEGFVAVFPQGTQDNSGVPHWNANLGNSTVNDHGFLVALAEHLQQNHELSAECTYACGMSNGGFMSYSLACQHPETFKAIGSVTGSMSGADFGCTPTEVVPIVHFHGTADLTVSYDDGVGFGGWGDAGVPEIIGHWTGLMGTTTLEESPLPNQETIDLTSVDFLRYAGAPDGQEFHHYRVNGGGHTWFGAFGSPDVDATAVLWDFFQSACNGQFTDVREAASPEASWLRWDGVQLFSSRDGRVQGIDLIGRVVYDGNMVGGGSSPIPERVHFVRAEDHQGQVKLLRIR